MMLSDVCLSVAYVGPKSRTERPRNTKTGTEVAHVTRGSDTTFKVKRSRSPGCFTHRRVGAWGGCSGGVGTCYGVGRGKLLLRCRLLVGAQRGEGRPVATFRHELGGSCLLAPRLQR